MHCTGCQQENRLGAKFCDECGTPLLRPSESGEAAPSYAELQHSLTEALEQQTATGEILRAIGQSPTDIQPIFRTIAERAAVLCDVEVSTVTRFDGESIHVAALYNVKPGRH